jgi:hypothetical protein
MSQDDAVYNQAPGDFAEKEAVGEFTADVVGSDRMNVVPAVGALSQVSLPPNAPAIRAATDSPKPVPSMPMRRASAER